MDRPYSEDEEAEVQEGGLQNSLATVPALSQPHEVPSPPPPGYSWRFLIPARIAMRSSSWKMDPGAQ